MVDFPNLRRLFRPPRWLKPWVVPAWNAGVHLARALGDRGRAVARRQVERCLVCGRVGVMIYRRRVIADELVRRWGLTERVARAVARKESMECSRCGAKLRGRRLARALLDLYPVGQPLRPAPSIADWAKTSEANQLRVAEINRVEGLHDALLGMSRFEPSDFLEGAKPGAVIDGVHHEDLTWLTYPDAAFDLVITSETLEHVPDLDAAWGEIRRVLAPGGRHVFTVPALPGTPSTFSRAKLAENGIVVDLAPPIFHPGGDVGYRVFTEFGADLPDIVRMAGFEVEVHFGPTTEDDVAQVYVARKPSS